MSRFHHGPPSLSFAPPTAPVDAMKERLELVSDQRAEQAEVENEMDKEHAHELTELRRQLAQQVILQSIDTYRLIICSSALTTKTRWFQCISKLNSFDSVER